MAECLTGNCVISKLNLQSLVKSKQQEIDIRNVLFLKDTVELELMMELFSPDWCSSECYCQLLVHLSFISNKNELHMLELFLNTRGVILSNIIDDIENELQSTDYSIEAVLSLFLKAIHWIQKILVYAFQMFCVIDANGFNLYKQLKLQCVKGVSELCKIYSNNSTDLSVDSAVSEEYSNGIPMNALLTHHSTCREVVHAWLNSGSVGELNILCQKWLSKINVSNTSLAITHCKNAIYTHCLCTQEVEGSFGLEWQQGSKYLFGNAVSITDTGNIVSSSYLWTTLFHTNFINHMSELVRSAIASTIVTFADEYINKYVLAQCCQLRMSLDAGKVEFERVSSARSAKSDNFTIDINCLFSPVKVFKIASNCSEYLATECASLLTTYKYYLETTQGFKQSTDLNNEVFIFAIHILK